jgi:hypothetical protein
LLGYAGPEARLLHELDLEVEAAAEAAPPARL